MLQVRFLEIVGMPSLSILLLINVYLVAFIFFRILKVYTLSTRYQLRITKNVVPITFERLLNRKTHYTDYPF